MTEQTGLQDPRIQDYIDGRLDPEARAEVAAELRGQPALAAAVEQLRHDTDMLQAIGQEVLDEPVPERLRAVLRRSAPPEGRARSAGRQDSPQHPARHHPRRGGSAGRGPAWWLARAAAVGLIFASGIGSGWVLNDLTNPAPSLEDVVLANVTQAFDFYDESDGYPVEFPADRATDFRDWISRNFARDIEPPDLAEFGYAFEGGRLFPSAGVRVGSFQFTGPDKGRLGVFFWPDEATAAAPMLGQAAPDITYHVWSGNGFSIAVMGRTETLDLDSAAEAVFAFYQDIFSSS